MRYWYSSRGSMMRVRNAICYKFPRIMQFMRLDSWSFYNYSAWIRDWNYCVTIYWIYCARRLRTKRMWTLLHLHLWSSLFLWNSIAVANSFIHSIRLFSFLFSSFDVVSEIRCRFGSEKVIVKFSSVKRWKWKCLKIWNCIYCEVLCCKM